MSENNSYFLPAVVTMLARVTEEAWVALAQDQRVLDKTLTRDQVAQRIIESASLGERDAAVIKAAAMRV